MTHDISLHSYNDSNPADWLIAMQKLLTTGRTKEVDFTIYIVRYLVIDNVNIENLNSRLMHIHPGCIRLN